MIDYAMTLVGVAVVLLLVILCRLFRIDELKKTTDIPIEELKNRSLAIYEFLDAKITPRLLDFEKKTKASGIGILRTELSVTGGDALIRFDVSESSLIGKHDGVIYPSEDAEAIEYANCAYIGNEIKEFFGDDPVFGRVATLNGDIDYYTFTIVAPGFGGEVKRFLDEDFSVEYERLKKKYADFEYGLLMGQLIGEPMFGRGF